MKTTGTLFLAFYDVRDAIAAKSVLSRSTDGVLVACASEESSSDGKQAWFHCRFITAEELAKVSSPDMSSRFYSTISVIDYWQLQLPCNN
jgi:hypothetical protein